MISTSELTQNQLIKALLAPDVALRHHGKRDGVSFGLGFTSVRAKFADWAEARKHDPSFLTEWQVYRMFDARRGAWSTFQFLVRQRLSEQGRDVASDGTLL